MLVNAVANKASVCKRRDGCGMGWNTLALCVGYHFLYLFIGLVSSCTVAPHACA